MIIKRILLSLAMLSITIYGLYCSSKLYSFIDTNEYWSNPWFYKTHACLAAAVILYLVSPDNKDKNS